MVNGKSILAIIPARGGSKGVPRKNIRYLLGKPLIAWTIESAQKSRFIDRLIVSSDDFEIIRTAEEFGCEAPFVRPAEFSSDIADGIAPIVHALETLPEKYDYVVLLQPTSPLRTADDIDSCIEHCIRHSAPVCLTICEAEKHPYKMFGKTSDERLSLIVPKAKNSSRRRQDMPKAFSENGAVYVMEAEWILREKTLIAPGTIGYEMPRERSMDIDTEMDFRLCEFLIKQQMTI